MLRKLALTIAMLCLFAPAVFAATPEEKALEARSQQAFQEMQRLATVDQYAEALTLLEGLWSTPGMLASDDRRMWISYGLIFVHAHLDHMDQAVRYLSQLADRGLLRSWVLEEVDQNSDLTAFREVPEVKAILAKATAWKRLWNSPALASPYRENLSEDEKIAGLSKFWAEVRLNFAFFDHLPDLDWDAQYLAYLPKVRATKSTLEYYRVLKQLCAQLKDTHTGIHLPRELREVQEAVPAVDTDLIEGKVLVTAVADDLTKDGVRVGLEVVEVEGLPVHEYARQHVMPYESTSTPQGLDRFTYHADLLAGRKDQPVAVTFRDAQGQTLTRKLPRVNQRWDSPLPWKPFDFRMFDGDIAYVALNTVGDESVVRSFDAALPQIEKAKALIIDLRGNGGGSSNIGWDILAYLTDKPFQTHRAVGRKYDPYGRARGWDPWTLDPMEGNTWSPNGGKLFRGPVVLLIGPGTGSAAEDMCIAFATMHRGKMIGEPTGGSTGQPLFIELPGGGSARICTIKSTFPDGKEFVGTGIQPDTVVRPTVADIRAGKDTVLEAAVAYLKQ